MTIQPGEDAPVRVQRRYGILGALSHEYSTADDIGVSMGVSDVTWTTLDHVVPEVDA